LSKSVVFSPQRVIERVLERLPARVRPAANTFASLLLWVLFVESAISLITGRPFVSDVVAHALLQLPSSLVGGAELLWHVLLIGAEYWRGLVRDPLISTLSAIGLRLDAQLVDLASATVFGAAALLRGVARANRFRRQVRKATEDLKQSPSVLYRTEKIAELICAYRPTAVEHDLPIVMRNLDTTILYIIEEILWHETEFREAAVNSTILINNTFGIANVYYRGGPGMKSFGEEVLLPVWRGERVLTDIERSALAAFLDQAMPYLFRDSIGGYFYKRIERIFEGTLVERRARLWAHAEIAFIALISAFAITVTVLDALQRLP
jgi:hypothetical protein